MDLNADLGEGGPADLELLDVVTSASVACGAHAGDAVTMVDTARMAVARGVAVGAHPSYPDRDGFGRRPLSMPVGELYTSVARQVAAMMAAAREAGTSVRFVKPHGALYNQAAADSDAAGAVVRAAADAGLPLLCPYGSLMHLLASEAGLVAYCEAFADRAYLPDGRLAPRGDAGAVLDRPADAARQAVRLALYGEVVATDGSVIPVTAHSLCIHGDTPGAPRLARGVRSALEGAGVAVSPFVVG